MNDRKVERTVYELELSFEEREYLIHLASVGLGFLTKLYKTEEEEGRPLPKKARQTQRDYWDALQILVHCKAVTMMQKRRRANWSCAICGKDLFGIGYMPGGPGRVRCIPHHNLACRPLGVIKQN